MICGSLIVIIGFFGFAMEISDYQSDRSWDLYGLLIAAILVAVGGCLFYFGRLARISLCCIFLLICGYFGYVKHFEKTKKPVAKDGSQKGSLVSNISNKSSKESSYFSNLPVNEKMRLADKYLREYKNNTNSLLNRASSGPRTPESKKKFEEQLAKVMADSSKKFNSLRMRCPSTVGKGAYLAWSKKYEQESKRIMDNFNKRLLVLQVRWE